MGESKFCIILVTWSTIQLLLTLLPRSWRWWTTLDCEIPSSPDDLQMLLPGFTKVGKMMNYTGLWDTKLAWYFLKASPWIYRGWEDDEIHWLVRCQAHLVLSECYSLDIPRLGRWQTTQDCEMPSSPDTLQVPLGAWLWNPQAYLIVEFLARHWSLTNKFGNVFMKNITCLNPCLHSLQTCWMFSEWLMSLKESIGKKCLD